MFYTSSLFPLPTNSAESAASTAVLGTAVETDFMLKAFSTGATKLLNKLWTLSTFLPLAVGIASTIAPRNIFASLVL